MDFASREIVAAPPDLTGPWTFQESNNKPSPEWISAVLSAAGAEELKEIKPVQNALSELFRVTDMHQAFFRAFPHLELLPESRESECRAGIEQRWKDTEPTKITDIVDALMATYKLYGFPIDAAEQASALLMHSEETDLYAYGQDGVKIHNILDYAESSLLKTEKVIDR